MLPNLGPLAGALMIISGFGLLCVTRSHHEHARTFRLMGVSSMIGGAAWFVPSEMARTIVMFAGTSLSVAAVVMLMIRTWRQASVHQ